MPKRFDIKVPGQQWVSGGYCGAFVEQLDGERHYGTERTAIRARRCWPVVGKRGPTAAA